MNAYFRLLFLLLMTFFGLEGMEGQNDTNNSRAYDLLFEGVATGDIDKVRQALLADIDVNVMNDELVSPLYRAAQGGYNDIIAVLVERGARVNDLNTTVGYQAIHVATSSGHLSTVQLLVGLGASPQARSLQGLEPLHWAATRGRLIIAQWLVEQGASVHAQAKNKGTALQLAAQFGHKEMVEWLVGQGADINIVNSQGNTALLDALIAGNRDIAQWLIEQGADVNIGNNNGSMPLIIARRRGYDHIVSLILERADSTLVSPEELYTVLNSQSFDKIKSFAQSNTRDARCNTLLHLAVTENMGTVITFLLSLGVDVNLKNRNGYAPIHMAAGKKRNRALLQLLEHGASAHTLTENNYNALDLAAYFGNRSTFEILLSWGGSINASNNQALNLVDIALIENRLEFALWLLWHGAQLSEQSRNILSLFLSRESSLLYEVMHNNCDEAKRFLDDSKLFISQKLIQELNQALPLAVAFGQGGLVKILLKDFGIYLTARSLENGLISAATQGNWRLFHEIYALISSVVPSHDLARILRNSFSWAATSGNVSFFQELYNLMHTTLTPADFVHALERALLRSAVQGNEHIVSFILERAFVDGHALNLDLNRTGRRVLLIMRHQDTPQELRAALERIYNSMAVVPRVRLVNRQAGATSTLDALIGVIQGLEIPLPTQVPPEIVALILRAAFRPPFSQHNNVG